MYISGYFANLGVCCVSSHRGTFYTGVPRVGRDTESLAMIPGSLVSPSVCVRATDKQESLVAGSAVISAVIRGLVTRGGTHGTSPGQRSPFFLLLLLIFTEKVILAF